MSSIKSFLTVLSALALAACAGFGPPAVPGQSEAQVLQRMGPPTDRYALEGGATRLEYASGPYGRVTWMIDVDAKGRVIDANQVLNEVNFAEFQKHAAGMSRQDLLLRLGRPGERRNGGWQGGEVWSWRYPTNNCLWFQVSIGDDGLVRDGIYTIDPRCDPPTVRDR
ncbi:MAG: hypothetical protein KGI35_10025 [Burkholderiales bacterium]|nr:hypothetical protein [Burkholderiales bacterium]